MRPLLLFAAAYSRVRDDWQAAGILAAERLEADAHAEARCGFDRVIREPIHAGAAKAEPRREKDFLERQGYSVVTAQNGVPWWYFHGVDGPYSGRQIETVDPGGAVTVPIGGIRVRSAQ